jgi:hypothetical protein
MSIRRVKIVLLCEDSQHEAFARRFLEGMRWNMRELRVEKSPTARGSAAQWVKETFPAEKPRKNMVIGGRCLVFLISATRQSKSRPMARASCCLLWGLQPRLSLFILLFSLSSSLIPVPASASSGALSTVARCRSDTPTGSPCLPSGVPGGGRP